MAESRISNHDQFRIIWRLGGLTPAQLAKRVWTEVEHDNVLGRASELAYNFVLSLFPLLLVLIALLGMLAERGTRMRELLFTYLGSVVPASASELISRTIEEVTSGSGGGKLTFGILLTLFTASSGTAAIMSALSAAYDVKDQRSWWKLRGQAILLTVALAMLVISALTVVLGGDAIADWVGGRVGLSEEAVLLWKIVQWPGAVFFVIFAFALVYYFGPDVKEQHWYWITPGALIGVLLWLGASFAFRLYLQFFDSYSATYGSLGAAIILLVWFWVTGMAFLVGGEINAEIEHAAAHRGHPEAKAEGEKAA